MLQLSPITSNFNVTSNENVWINVTAKLLDIFLYSFSDCHKKSLKNCIQSSLLIVNNYTWWISVQKILIGQWYGACEVKRLQTLCQCFYNCTLFRWRFGSQKQNLFPGFRPVFWLSELEHCAIYFNIFIQVKTTSIFAECLLNLQNHNIGSKMAAVMTWIKVSWW